MLCPLCFFTKVQAHTSLLHVACFSKQATHMLYRYTIRDNAMQLKVRDNDGWMDVILYFDSHAFVFAWWSTTSIFH